MFDYQFFCFISILYHLILQLALNRSEQLARAPNKSCLIAWCPLLDCPDLHGLLAKSRPLAPEMAGSQLWFGHSRYSHRWFLLQPYKDQLVFARLLSVSEMIFERVKTCLFFVKSLWDLTMEAPTRVSNIWMEASAKARPATVKAAANVDPSSSIIVTNTSIWDFGYKCWKKKNCTVREK